MFHRNISSKNGVDSRHLLRKLSKVKSGEIWEMVQSGDDPPSPQRGWDFLKWVDPPPPKINFLKRNNPLKRYWYKISQYK